MTRGTVVLVRVDTMGRPRRLHLVERRCVRCDKDYYLRPSEASSPTARYCSLSCVNRRGVDPASIETRICDGCGVSFTVRKYEVARGYGRCCSRSCRGRVGINKLQASMLAVWPRHALKKRAYAIVNRAIKSGLLRRQPCESCGTLPEIARIEAHHDDYLSPLDVRWLCNACHKRHHYSLRPAVVVEAVAS